MRAGPRYGLTVIALALAVASPAAAQAPAQAPAAPAARAGAMDDGYRVGVFDMQRVLVKSTSGMAARESLERERAVMLKDADGKRVELEKLRDELDKKGPLMTAEARREREDVFERKRRDFARLRDDYTKELEKKEQELLRRVLREVQGVIQQVASKGRFLVIIEKQYVAYMAPNADVTDDIIRAYDQEAAAKGKK
ncbi:MAG: OmpH family outer membrane protein [Candidatus Rokubacteria bacterium]|nr:OmpH family outer membrane protein [Candidatus Rokubacteria bacterium]